MIPVMDEVVTAYGGIPKVQARFGYGSPMAVYNWRSRGIPKGLIADIHVDTGIAIDRLKSCQQEPIRIHSENDNDAARKVTAAAVRSGFLAPPTDFACLDCSSPAQCYDHRDYNKPLEVDPVCLQCNRSRGKGIPFFSPHRSINSSS